jgi:hypothetical protein
MVALRCPPIACELAVSPFGSIAWLSVSLVLMHVMGDTGAGPLVMNSCQFLLQVRPPQLTSCLATTHVA